MVASIFAGGGLVPGICIRRRPAWCLLMLRNGRLLWGWNRDAGRRLKPHSPGTRVPTGLWHECSPPSPEFRGPSSSSLSRSPGRRPEHHQRKTNCYFLNLTSSRNARLCSPLFPFFCPIAHLWESNPTLESQSFRTAFTVTEPLSSSSCPKASSQGPCASLCTGNFAPGSQATAFLLEILPDWAGWHIVFSKMAATRSLIPGVHTLCHR